MQSSSTQRTTTSSLPWNGRSLRSFVPTCTVTSSMWWPIVTLSCTWSHLLSFLWQTTTGFQNWPHLNSQSLMELERFRVMQMASHQWFRCQTCSRWRLYINPFPDRLSPSMEEALHFCPSEAFCQCHNVSQQFDANEVPAPTVLAISMSSQTLDSTSLDGSGSSSPIDRPSLQRKPVAQPTLARQPRAFLVVQRKKLLGAAGWCSVPKSGWWRWRERPICFTWLNERLWSPWSR